MEDANLHRLRDAVVQTWNLPVASSGALENRDAILEALARRVRQLLDHDFDRLLSAMYLLDVSEEQFRNALTQGDLTQGDLALGDLELGDLELGDAQGDNKTASERLAGIILEREIEKMESRERFKRGS